MNCVWVRKQWKWNGKVNVSMLLNLRSQSKHPTKVFYQKAKQRRLNLSNAAHIYMKSTYKIISKWFNSKKTKLPIVNNQLSLLFQQIQSFIQEIYLCFKDSLSVCKDTTLN